eukprot:TRINITY_DN80224_c0_g1_i1.p1 TRINITY_DN80224_c0_g1~~TRINITY_DN80224_c0_g1_i1.p1  ORF type:complete len:471 (+),score=86.07 TRINITY_DN80224_c0_g1_i1:65-1414(+)
MAAAGACFKCFKGAVKSVRRFLAENVFWFAAKAAFANAVLAALLKALCLYGPDEYDDYSMYITANPSTVSSLSFLIGLFVAFRASQAYARFWEGASSSLHIVATLTETASSLFSFTVGSKASAEKLDDFRQQLVRYFSIIHSLMLAELESTGAITGKESSLAYDILDPTALDPQVYERIQANPAKVHLVFYWIQRLIMENLQEGVVCAPPPICTRAFNELNNCMKEFHNALRLTETPFPYPYTMATNLSLCVHWFITCTVSPTLYETLPATFGMAFVQVFMLWSLNAIATELENPFGHDINDVDGKALHDDLNLQLSMLLEEASKSRPSLCEKRPYGGAPSVASSSSSLRNMASLNDVMSGSTSRTDSRFLPSKTSADGVLSEAQAACNMNVDDKVPAAAGRSSSKPTSSPPIRTPSMQREDEAKTYLPTLLTGGAGQALEASGGSIHV